MADIFRRARNYYKTFGFKRSMYLLYKKSTGRTPWNLRQPAIKSERYLKDHSAVATRAKSNEPSNLDGKAAQDVNGVEAFVAASTIPTRGAKLFALPTIVIIGDLNLAQCKKFRVIQKVEALQALGYRSYYSHWQDVPRCVNLLQIATFVIFYRLADNELFRGYVGEARRLGLTAGYDIDDPIFDKNVYASNRNLYFLSNAERNHLVDSSPSYLRAMEACDLLIFSTPGVQSLARQKLRKPSYVWRNAVDAETVHAAKLASYSPRLASTKDLIIGYASGSRAHEADFREAESALLKIMKLHANAQLIIIGYHDLSPKLRELGDRISTVGFSDYESYISLVSHFDINIVPLLRDKFNDCKSAIRFLDAAVVGVPTVASRIGDFVNVVEDGVTGLLARGSNSWFEQINSLVKNTQRRKTMGKRAKEVVEKNMSAVAIAKALDCELIGHFAK